MHLYTHFCRLSFMARCVRDTPPFHRSGCWSPTHLREYVNTRRTIPPPIHSWKPSVPCGCCTCLEFLATQCSVYVVAGFLRSASKDSPVRCVISSLTLDAILELSFCTVPLQQFLWQRHLNHIHSFIHSFIHSIENIVNAPCWRQLIGLVFGEKDFDIWSDLLRNHAQDLKFFSTVQFLTTLKLMWLRSKNTLMRGVNCVGETSSRLAARDT